MIGPKVAQAATDGEPAYTDAKYRTQVEDVLEFFVPGNTGAMVSLSEVVAPVSSTTAKQLTRHNGSLATSFSREGAPSVVRGDAMAEIEHLVDDLAPGLGIE